MSLRLLAILTLCALNIARNAVLINEGLFTPLYGVKNDTVKLAVGAFYIDRYPVTNSDFQLFVKNSGKWRQIAGNSIMADQGLLKHWQHAKSGMFPLKADFKKPVVNISWFAAAEYCEWKGGRLPTVLEWEYVAAASADKKDASRDPEFVERLLSWYGTPSRGEKGLNPVGKSRPNAWGVYDLHGLVWEWTADFNSVFVAGDSRREGEALKNLFCGAGAESAVDKANYAAFLRYAMRNSLRGNYTTSNLGFRCAYDLK